MQKLMAFIKENWAYVLGFVLGIVVMVSALTGKKRRVTRRKRRKPVKRTSKSATRTSKNIPSRIKTKSGKLITGKDNVRAYMNRLKNLRKARRANKK